MNWLTTHIIDIKITLARGIPEFLFVQFCMALLKFYKFPKTEKLPWLLLFTPLYGLTLLYLLDPTFFTLIGSR